MDSGRRNQIVGLAGLLIIGICASCGGQVIYVDDDAAAGGDGSSWANACRCLQDALAQAAEAPQPVEIRVAQGVYRPDQGAGVNPGSQTATFQLLSGVTLRGGYAGAPDPDARDVELYETVLSGDLAGNDGLGEPTTYENSRHVVTGSGMDATAVLDGFTITGGGAGMLIETGGPTIRNCRFEDNTGNGIQCGHSRAAITGCLFTGNRSPALDGSDCSSVLTDCVFKAGGTGRKESGIWGVRSDLTLVGCTFEGLAGGCIDISDGHLTLLCCTFADSSGTLNGAVHCADGLTARDCTFVNNSGLAAGAMVGGNMELENCAFTGNSGTNTGAILAGGDVLIATGCLFSGNRSQQGAGAISIASAVLRLSNCTFIGNRGLPSTLACPSTGKAWYAELRQCIVWDGLYAFSRWPGGRSDISVTYSDVQGGHPGEGNIDIDPCFVEPGHWADPNDPTKEIGPEDPCAVWVAGDCHLKSQGGRWDRATQVWVRDVVTSPCIDAGDPNTPVGDEPFPNGGFVNMGAYGGTAEASKSYFGEPVCETEIPGDINGDCRVDETDRDILLLQWLAEEIATTNVSPAVEMISPADGAELTSPTPIVLAAAASDPDGKILWITYHVEYRSEGTWSGGGTVRHNPAERGWAVTWLWSAVHYDGRYTIWAEVVDDQGAKATSLKITVTLHPTN
jgi:hypothetical protein